jgi:hypothetical protein
VVTDALAEGGCWLGTVRTSITVVLRDEASSCSIELWLSGGAGAALCAPSPEDAPNVAVEPSLASAIAPERVWINPSYLVVQQLLISALRRAIRLITCVKLLVLNRGSVSRASSLAGLKGQLPIPGKSSGHRGSGGATGPTTVADSSVQTTGGRVGRTTGQ